MSETTIAIIGLVGNLLLLLVTGSYVILTRSMASASRDSAKASVDAARYAAQSVQAALAALDVEFELAPKTVGTAVEDPGATRSVRTMTGVRVESTASNIFVHGVRIDSYAYETPATEVARLRRLERAVSQDLPIVMATGGETERLDEIDAPVLLHKSESADFLFEGELPRPDGSKLLAMSVVVFYALDAQSIPRARLVNWRTAERPIVM